MSNHFFAVFFASDHFSKWFFNRFVVTSKPEKKSSGSLQRFLGIRCTIAAGGPARAARLGPLAPIPGGYGATDSEKSLQEAKWFLSGLDAASNPYIFHTILPNVYN